VTYLGPPVEFGNLIQVLDADGTDNYELSGEHLAVGHECRLQSDGRRV
jgi:hypothetical protein